MNKMMKVIQRLEQLPAPLRQPILTWGIRRTIPYVATSRLFFEEVSLQQVVVTLNNRRAIRNHIKGIHALASALAGESASGICLATHLPDDKLPLLQSMHLTYNKRCIGDIRVRASLTSEQIEQCQNAERGMFDIPVHFSDGEGKEYITGYYTWAWVPKKKSVDRH